MYGLVKLANETTDENTINLASLGGLGLGGGAVVAGAQSVYPKKMQRR